MSLLCQKSVTLPFLSQSPYLVGSGPRGPPISPVFGLVLFGHSLSGSFSWYGCFPTSNSSNFPTSKTKK